MAGRCFTIVETIEVMTPAQILAEDVTMHDIAFETPLEAIRWATKRCLLRNNLMCQVCATPMCFVPYRTGKDGHRWRCRGCAGSKSLRYGSFFQKSNLTLSQIIVLTYCWARDMSQREMIHEARLGPRSKHATVDWCNYFRGVCERYLEDHPPVIGGWDEDRQESKVVEIDKSNFFHRNYDRGQWREEQWVFGGIERGSGKCFLVEVPDRTANTLEALIRQYILPGAIVVSKGWAAYANINQIDGGAYEHVTVIHPQNFVHPEDDTMHTQNVENMWMRAKRKLRRLFDTSNSVFTSYLHEFVWRNRFPGQRNLFGPLMLAIAEQYPVD